MGRAGLPPGIYFRLLLIGYFEGIDWGRSVRRLLSATRATVAVPISEDVLHDGNTDASAR